MKPPVGARVRVAVILVLLSAGVLTPVMVAGQSGAPHPTLAQLSSLVSAAEGSRAYAAALVGYASSNSLPVAQSQEDMSKGDVQLASAQSSLQGGSNLESGVQSAQAAMGYYASAAAAASLALSGSGIAASTDYSLVMQQVAEVNASASAVASVGANACASAAVQAGPAGLAQACSQLDASLSASTADLEQASSLAVKANGSAQGSASFAQAITLVAAARAAINSTQDELGTIASYGYVQRADSYIAAYVRPLSLEANSTIQSESAANSSFHLFMQAFQAYALTQNTSVGAISGSASGLASAIAAVNSGSVSSSVAAAASVASDVSSDVTSLLALAGISAYPGVVADATRCQAGDQTFTEDLSAAGSASAAFSQTTLPSFSSFAQTLGSDAAAVSSSGSTYSSTCAKVTSDLSGLALLGVSAIYNSLTALDVSGSVGGVDGSFTQELTEVSVVQTEAGSFAAAAGEVSGVMLPSTLASSAAVQAANVDAYLNSSGKAAAAQMNASFQDLARGALTYADTVAVALNGSVGLFAGNEAAVASAGTALAEGAASTGASVQAASAYLGSDIHVRTTKVASAEAGESTAMQLFSNLEVAEGASALAQASLDFQAASALNG